MILRPGVSPPWGKRDGKTGHMSSLRYPGNVESSYSFMMQTGDFTKRLENPEVGQNIKSSTVRGASPKLGVSYRLLVELADVSSSHQLLVMLPIHSFKAKSSLLLDLRGNRLN